jgi:hypothetical protein
MKTFSILFLAVLLAVAAAHAGIVGTNTLPLATYSAGSIVNSNFVPPQTHFINPHSFTLYHSATNFTDTNYAQISYDGGTTWATYATNITSTNLQTETWTPNTTQGSLNPINRVLTLNSTNQTLLNQVNWVQ